GPLPAVLVQRRARAWIAWRHVPPGPHAHAYPTVLDPSAWVARSIGRNCHRRPRHTHAAAFKIKAMHRPLLARVRIDRRPRRKGALLALAQYPIALVVGAHKNGPTGNDRAPERHHQQLVGASCRCVDREERAEEP